MLLLPLGHPTERQGVAPLYSSLQSYASITKSVEQINTPERTSQVMRRAFAALRQGRPGPVAVEIPADVCDYDVSEEAFYYVPSRGAASQGDPGDVEAAARALCAASNPVILAGQGVMYAKASAELQELAELLQAPVTTTLLGKSAFSETHPLGAGFGGAYFVVDGREFHTPGRRSFRYRHQLHPAQHGDDRSAGQDDDPLHQRRLRHQQGLQHRLSHCRRRQAGAAANDRRLPGDRRRQPQGQQYGR